MAETRNTSSSNRGVANSAVTGDDETSLRRGVVITVQPQSENDGQLSVPTLDGRNNPRGQYIPKHGLDFLVGVKDVILQHTEDLSGCCGSKYRHIVRVPNGEALYIASETSNSTQRCLCGSGRAFVMHLHDKDMHETLVLKRRLAGFCRLQEMKVTTPSGEYLGRIEQQWTWVVPFYLVRDGNDDVLFIIEGPAMRSGRAIVFMKFKIMTSDTLLEVGNIVHSWDRELVSFVTAVKFPDSASTPRHKALLLAAAFLMNYTYFINRTRLFIG